VTFDVPNTVTVNLRERDVILSDDYLYSFQISPNSPSGVYTQTQPTRENGCMYAVDLTIKNS
jgi:hypothetical protein